MNLVRDHYELLRYLFDKNKTKEIHIYTKEKSIVSNDYLSYYRNIYNFTEFTIDELKDKQNKYEKIIIITHKDMPKWFNYEMDNVYMILHTDQARKRHQKVKNYI